MHGVCHVYLLQMICIVHKVCNRTRVKKMSLLAVEPPGPVDPALLATPGAFAWWYADLLDEYGDGAVLVWAWGLPFLPGIASAEREGRPEAPLGRPALGLAVYRAGRPYFYTLRAHAPDEVEGDGTTWRFGRSRIASRAHDDVRSLVADLDLDVPGGGRATARLEIAGAAARLDAVGASAHRWAPRTACARGTLTIESDGGRLAIAGRAWHDGNYAPAPLHRLGMRAWCWGRVALPDADLLWYALRGEDGADERWVVRLGPDGTGEAREDAGLVLGDWRRDRYGLTLPGRVSLGDALDVRAGAVVDRGPFYLRWLVSAREVDGRVGHGFAEVCRPDRVDLAPWRPFVRMRVDGPGRAAFLPLFTGPAEGRLGRLLRHWRG